MIKKKSLRSYLVTERKRWALSQKHLAVLLGSKTSNRTSRHERHLRTPDLKTALAYEVIFGVPLRRLFKGLYEEVEEEVIARAYRLYLTVEHRQDQAGKKKAALLKAMMDRAIAETNQKRS